MSVECENCGRPTHVLRGSRIIMCHVACTVEEALSSPHDLDTFVKELFEQKKDDMRKMIKALRREIEKC